MSVTQRRLAGIGALLVLASLAGGLGWAALAPLSPRPPAARELLYVIPKGAAALGARGEGPFGLPAELHLQLGVRDILVLRNEDDAEQQLGPVVLAPGQTYRLPFHQPGAIQLACTFHQGIGVILYVAPPPSPGWERLWWRLGGSQP
ncbi:MAG TPA: hypothetical protein VL691_04970 [Vicinamibacteria bacterium]|nr:hypothetical protein [Vicinamibacteria bacterium]